MTSRDSRFPLADSLRALAAFSVLMFHVLSVEHLDVQGLRLPQLARFTSHLDVGVTIFFVISGFLLYRPFARARLEHEPSPAVGPYALRRFLRIVPAYWIALAAGTLWLSIPGVFESAPRYFGFAQVYSPATALGGIPQAWTLCVEISFYALLPLYAGGMRLARVRTSRRWLATEAAGLLVLVGASLVYKVLALRHVDADSLKAAPWLLTLPGFLDQFALGMALAVGSLAVEAGALPDRGVSTLRRWPTLPWAVAIAAYVVTARTIGASGPVGAGSQNDQVLARHGLYSLIAVCVVLPAVTTHHVRRGVARRILALRPLLWAGLVSYGVYLWHVFVFSELLRGLGAPSQRSSSLVVLLTTFVGSLAAGALSYYLVERPALSLRSGFRRTAAANEEPGAASAPSRPPAA
jgi:peptidoglycan/LPS O-acetylase OafA/YrhL